MHMRTRVTEVLSIVEGFFILVCVVWTSWSSEHLLDVFVLFGWAAVLPHSKSRPTGDHDDGFPRLRYSVDDDDEERG